MGDQPPRRGPERAAPWAETYRHLIPGGKRMGARELEYWALDLTRGKRQEPGKKSRRKK